MEDKPSASEVPSKNQLTSADREEVPGETRPFAQLDSDLDTEILSAIDRILTGQTGWMARLSILGGSLLLFIILGWIVSTVIDSFSVLDLVILIVVIFIHEAGHYLGMLLFGYRNVKMFFVPLLGAAVSGYGIQASVVERAMVLLLGPIPGLLIGYILGILYAITRADVWLQFASVFVMLNALNLLPLYPLDGGQFLSWMLVDRPSWLQALSQVVLLVLISGITFFGPDIPFLSPGFLFGFCITRIPWLLTISKLALIVRNHDDFIHPESNESIPQDAARLITTEVKREMSGRSSKAIAQTVIQVWQIATAKRPRLKDKAILLSIYVLCWMSLAFAWYIYGAFG